jgi:hypothetical protein
VGRSRKRCTRRVYLRVRLGRASSLASAVRPVARSSARVGTRLVPVGVKREPRPQPPHRHEQQAEPAERGQRRVLQQRAGQLSGGTGERQVKKSSTQLGHRWSR